MNHSRPQLFGMLAGLFLAAGLIFSSMLGTTAWVKIKNSQFVTVKGSTHKNIESDLVVWRGNFSGEAAELLEAQRALKANRVKVEQFLTGSGITNFVFTPINIEEIKASLKDASGWVQQRTTGYRLSQSVRVESGEIDRIDRLDTAPLVEQGMIFTTDLPQFIYTKAGEAKVEMLADATKDARARAEQIATQGGRTIASLHDADMGVFQITPRHATRTSWEGESDTSSSQKTITAVVTATFLLK
ncbi:MAG: SIMPL domain-containing protein [Verrucomicrobiales bacterium]|nr:SIMPL domain-containing protein [Verrucomicrobiales bacterium]